MSKLKSYSVYIELPELLAELNFLPNTKLRIDVEAKNEDTAIKETKKLLSNLEITNIECRDAIYTKKNESSTEITNFARTIGEFNRTLAEFKMFAEWIGLDSFQ